MVRDPRSVSSDFLKCKQKRGTHARRAGGLEKMRALLSFRWYIERGAVARRKLHEFWRDVRSLNDEGVITLLESGLHSS